MRFAALTAAVAALATVASSAGAPPLLKQKEAQARQVLAQVQALDVRLGRTVEAWNGARYELGKLRVQERKNAVALAIARKRFRIAERRAEQRLVELYESEEPSTTDAVLGATTLSDMLNRLDLVNAASALDHRIARRVEQARDALVRKGAELAAERRKQVATVRFLSGQRVSIQSGLAHRKTLLASVQGQVSKLLEQERVRQALLAAHARAQVQADLRRAALERLRAEAAARARAAKPAAKKPSKPTAPAPTTPAGTDPTTTTTTTTATAAPPTPPPTIPTSLPSGHPEAASIALQYLGIPYQWGGASPETGFDCSGLVMYVYAQIGIFLPHFAAAQYGYGAPVARDQLQAGDLVFFDKLNHVGISLGGDQFVEAPHTGDFVKIESISGWYAANYVGARRL